MYSTQNNNQSQESPVFNQPHQVIIERWTKPRAYLDGNGSNRGILLKSTIDGSNKWMTLWSGHHIFRDMKWGSSCFYDPNLEPHERLKIGTAPPINNSQARADYYNRMADRPHYEQALDAGMNGGPSIYESIEQGLNNSRPQGYQYDINDSQPNTNQNGQPSSSDNTINETLLEKNCLLLSNAVNLMSSLNPQLDEESIVKLAISASIAYGQQIKDMPE